MIATITKHEFAAVAGAKASKVMLGVTIGIILILGVVGRIFLPDFSENAEKPKDETVLVVGVEPQMAEYQKVAESYPKQMAAGPLTFESVTAEKAKAWLKEKDDADNTIGIVLAGKPGAPETIQIGQDGRNAGPRAFLSQVAAAWVVEKATGNPATPEQIAALASASALPSTQVSNGGIANIFDDPSKMIPAFVTLTLLMMAIVMGISQIGAGVVQEKQSRVVEILLSSVKPNQLLTGKILGIGAYALLYYTATMASIIAAVYIAGLGSYISVTSLLSWSLIWVVIGFFTYATLTAAIAATVSRQEDLAQANMPLTLTALVGFYVALYLVPASPDGPVTTALSYVPFLSPFMMPMREAFGAVPLWSQILSALVSIAVFPLLAWVAGRIYKGSVLRTGKRIKLTDAFRAK
ncbi:ABC-2 type transport system permease protein [Arcanobacterium wilhelmae]|uniref:ABC-2 type transport system permease protein n=1 Tax=Arcanobacterium wilhelmae TaxID=1803177 RepID=A0ABT9NCH2_9ACTO|nr:ABC transporter permease [Arcanobacterium wilhelmae]MDP9801213.1 ABC-2 type transport system permease protein [Arcanobacterium wilhelmae]WFN90563.1 ABC transporter permease [Arcanobacterium wilhelmae]